MTRGFVYRCLCLYCIGTDISMSEQGFYVENDTPLTRHDRHDLHVSGFAYLLERKRRRSSTRAVLPEDKNPAGRRRRSTTVVLPEDENPASRRRYQSCTTRERKSSRLPATAVPVLNYENLAGSWRYSLLLIASVF